MKIELRQIVISLVALLVAVLTVIGFVRNPAAIGELPLIVRALILNLAVLAALVAAFPLNPVFRDRPGVYGLVVCLPALIPGFVYFLLLLPNQLSDGIAAEQLRSDLITDGSSNGIVEVGFAYPIYTPTVSLRNSGLYTKQVNLFLRMIDANGDSALFRSVRNRVPGSGLSVESTVQGMLSRNDGYLFNPVTLPPGVDVSGKLIFVISNLEDGTSFIDALGYAYQAQFEIRDPTNGALIEEFPLNRI
ncbi:MAG: hypothetical protein MI746_01095 [Pseudomonadales bacterium]|nr:hypothetical protein [Pseudomonadales bacterium]